MNEKRSLFTCKIILFTVAFFKTIIPTNHMHIACNLSGFLSSMVQLYLTQCSSQTSACPSRTLMHRLPVSSKFFTSLSISNIFSFPHRNLKKTAYIFPCPPPQSMHTQALSNSFKRMTIVQQCDRLWYDDFLFVLQITAHMTCTLACLNFHWHSNRCTVIYDKVLHHTVTLCVCVCMSLS